MAIISASKLSPPNVTTLLDKEQIIRLITQGLPSYPEMPSFPDLSQEEAGEVADHLFN